jgi:LysR family cys regulon transcriptional activator
MNFQQLRIIRETARCSFNLTEVASVLYTSQSGISRHIKDLEDELGVEIFVRKGKRLLGFTQPGEELLTIVNRILLDAQNIRNLADHFSHKDEGQLTVATTHSQARYVLPGIVKRFKDAFPRVLLILHQGSPDEIVAMLQDGRADIGIATEALQEVEALESHSFYEWRHGIVVPKGHPLATREQLTLADVVKYPVVTYHEGYTGRKKIDEGFIRAGLHADIVMTALDADVIKTYVELGLGVGIIASIAYQEERDIGLTLLDNLELFDANTTRIAVRKGHFLREFALHFMQLCRDYRPSSS